MTLEPIRPNPTSAAPAADPTTDEQSELDLGVISTGSPDIDKALAPLEGLGERPVSDHPEVYEQVLGQLSATMADHTAQHTADHTETAQTTDSADRANRDNAARPFGGG